MLVFPALKNFGWRIAVSFRPDWFQRKTLSQNKRGMLLMEMSSRGLTQRGSFLPGTSFLSKKAGMSS